MWADKILDAILERCSSNGWPERFKAGFEALFGSNGGRYPDNARRQVTLRAPAPSESSEGIVPFAALIHPANPSSGPYGGTSFAVFPGENAPCLLTLVVGTNGLAPDEAILGRPGHARKAKALYAPLEFTAHAEERCFEVTDSRVTAIPARFLLRGQASRDPASQIARLADQFVEGNRATFRQLDLIVEPHYRTGNIELDIHAGTRIGAIPLLFSNQWTP